MSSLQTPAMHDPYHPTQADYTQLYHFIHGNSALSMTLRERHRYILSMNWRKLHAVLCHGDTRYTHNLMMLRRALTRLNRHALHIERLIPRMEKRLDWYRSQEGWFWVYPSYEIQTQRMYMELEQDVCWEMMEGCEREIIRQCQFAKVRVIFAGKICRRPAAAQDQDEPEDQMCIQEGNGDDMQIDREFEEVFPETPSGSPNE